jgi:hypothetical protein
MTGIAVRREMALDFGGCTPGNPPDGNRSRLVLSNEKHTVFRGFLGDQPGGSNALITTVMVAAVDATLVRVVIFEYMDLANTLPRRLIILVIAAGLLFVGRGMAQLPPEFDRPIISFYNGVLFIVGDAWFPTDPSAKPIKTHIRILCKRRLGICALATSDGDAGVAVEFLTVVSWTSKRVSLRDERLHPSCAVSDYIVDRAGSSVSLISSPGLHAERVECRTGPYQKPKRTVYDLARHIPQR